jgi:hypothetical protein
MNMKKTIGRRAGKRAAMAVAAAALLGLPSCADVPQLAPPGATMTVFASPEDIAADGGVSVITAIITEAVGTPVPDGTVVQFFTNIGKIDREGLTKDGVARVNLISDTRSGTANVQAISGPLTAPTTVRIGEAVASTMIVIADPSRITTSRSTHIIATVLDGNGNPVPNIGVIFTVNSNTEFMDSQGHPIFTDNNGRAEDILRTKRTTPGSVTVNVQTLGGVTGSVTVPILLQ